jgi:hypothetical protein
VRAALAERYADALDAGLTDAMRTDTALSGVFLPDVPSGYLASPMRVMLLGKETQQWFQGIAHVQRFPTMRAYAESSMQESRRVAGIAPGKSKFGQFRKRLDEALLRHSGQPVQHLWSNLFCTAHHRGSPVRSAQFQDICTLSKALLQAQMEVLQPDVLLFTTGVGTSSYDAHIRALLPVTDSSTGMAHHIPGQLWTFKVQGRPAYRTAHPRFAGGEPGRSTALEKIVGQLAVNVAQWQTETP